MPLRGVLSLVQWGVYVSLCHFMSHVGKPNMGTSCPHLGRLFYSLHVAQLRQSVGMHCAENRHFLIFKLFFYLSNSRKIGKVLHQPTLS